MEKQIHIPILDRSVLEKLQAGDLIYLSGTLYTARDQAHKRIMEAVKCGGKLPFELTGNIIYYCGPTPPREDNLFGSAGPTTSARMDGFTPKLYELGLAGTIGKGGRADAVKEACIQYKSIYLVSFGGAGAYLAKCIKKQEIIAYPDLGAEAVYKLQIENFPAVVAFDIEGRSIF